MRPIFEKVVNTKSHGDGAANGYEILAIVSSAVKFELLQHRSVSHGEKSLPLTGICGPFLSISFQKC